MLDEHKWVWGVVALLVLGVLSWGIGWGTHAFINHLDPVETLPGTTASFEATLPPVLLPTSTVSVPAPEPVQMQQPTSTPAPTFTLSPAASRITVQEGDLGLYDVCRRYCSEKWPGRTVSPELDTYARQVAQLNGLAWGNRGPRITPEQELEMPACP